MCHSCWACAGSPKIDTPAVREAARLVGVLYETEGAGGLLHVVVDDMNAEDDHVAWCRAQIEKSAERDWAALHMPCLVALEGLTEPERYSALALHDGYWEVQT